MFGKSSILDFVHPATGREMAELLTGNIYALRSEELKEQLANFQYFEHRMELVGIIKGVTFINDAKSTNVNSTWFAMESAYKPVIWIAGGINRNGDYSVLKPLVQQKVKAMICLGDNSDAMNQYFGKDILCIINANNLATVRDPREIMKKVVALAQGLSVPGDTVLLSPAAASFDYFEKGYEQKGKLFKEAVLNL